MALNLDEENGEKNAPSDPFEGLKKHFNDILGTSGSKLGFVFPSAGYDDNRSDDDDTSAKEESEFIDRIKNFNMKPREIRNFLDRFVIKQAEAKKVLSVAVCDHYNHVRRCLLDDNALKMEYSKQNVLILGPTGVGKTYLIKNIAKLIGVPFVKVDATKFSETGYVGSDVDDMIRDLIKAANGNITLAEYGIVFIDEVDKIAMVSDAGGRDVSGRGVQINLLKLMEDSDVSAYSQTDMLSQLRAAMSFANGKKDHKQSISTKHILFIASGAFDKLSDIVKSRIGAKSIGFSVKIAKNDVDETYEYLQNASTSDFIKYGFEPEFIGRLPVRVACEALNSDDLKNILTSSEGSILKQYVEDFNGYGIKFTADDGALSTIAKLAASEKTGARGLLTVLEKLLRDFKFELPSTVVKSVKISEKTVSEPGKALAELMKGKSTATEAKTRRTKDTPTSSAGGRKNISVKNHEFGGQEIVQIQ
ncbi:MAG: AAA family ATPase [Puniceicoccales bacterium]|jgi:endopeptidase Clp ATP-binding regulatory subunit ClpX|nr:AAA family ATPase [Puniceicoccales bacterium]